MGGHLNGELLLSVTESLCGAGDGIVLAMSVSFVGECRLWRVLSLCSNETCASRRFPPLFFLQSATAARLCGPSALREGGQPPSPTGCPGSVNRSHRSGLDAPCPCFPPLQSHCLSPVALSTEVAPTVGGGEGLPRRGS